MLDMNPLKIVIPQNIDSLSQGINHIYPLGYRQKTPKNINPSRKPKK
jgi:hypothetical protein